MSCGRTHPAHAPARSPARASSLPMVPPDHRVARSRQFGSERECTWLAWRSMVARVSTAYEPATALVVVDVQNDFADPSGSLYVRGGEEDIPFVNEEIR